MNSMSDTINLLKQVGVALATCFNMFWLEGSEFIRGLHLRRLHPLYLLHLLHLPICSICFIR